MYLTHEHTRKAPEVFVREEAIAEVVQREQYSSDMIRGEKERNEDKIEGLEHEVARLKRKEIINEKALIE